MLKHVRALVAAASLLAVPNAALAQSECDAAQAALVELFPGKPGEYALDGMGNLGRVKLFLDLAGPCLSRRYSGNPDDDCYGWYGLSANGEPVAASPPAKETLEALVSSPAVDAAVACPALRTATQSTMGWREPSSKPLKLKPNGLYAYTSVGLTLPVVVSGSEAVAWVEQQSGPLAGGSYLVLLRRDDEGRWRLAGRFPISIS